MNPNLQELLHQITTSIAAEMDNHKKRIEKLEKQESLRDYFASKLMVHFMSDKKLSTTLGHYDFLEKVSKLSYEYADAMIKARETTK